MKELFDHTACLTLEEIQDYAKDRLDEAGRFRVENHLLDCALCRAALEGYLGNPEETSAADVALLQQQVKDFQQPKIVPVQKNRFNAIAAAVALLVLAGAAALYWQHTRYDRLYAAFFTAPDAEGAVAMRGGGPDTAGVSPEFREAMRYYEAGAYADAVPHFDRYLEQHPEDFATMLYAGIASLNGGYPEKAAEQLTTAGINDAKLFDEANWYLALAFVKDQNLVEARDILENLSERAEGRYAEKAKALLETMD